MARWWAAGFAVLACSVALAGCAGDESAGDQEGQPPEGGREPWELAIEAEGCQEPIGVLLVELSRLQSSLPPNVTAADAQGFLGMPAATGRGVLFANGVTCPGPSGSDAPETAGEVAIYIEPPTVAGAELPPVTYDLYTFAYHTSNVTVRGLLADAGLEAIGGTLAAAASGGLPSQGAFSIAEGPMDHAFTIDAVPADPASLTARFYHALDDGLIVWEYDIQGSASAQGAVTACSFPEGSILSTLSGWDRCDEGPSAALLFPDQSWTGRIAYLPGASL